MSEITFKCNRIQYEKRLSEYLHNCSGIEALERHQHLISRSSNDRFYYVYRLKLPKVKNILKGSYVRPWSL
jgi:hypothetical protein